MSVESLALATGGDVSVGGLANSLLVSTDGEHVTGEATLKHYPALLELGRYTGIFNIGNGYD